MKNLNKEKKVEVLLVALEERYRSLHIIRGRVQNVGIWALGILLAASGWLIQSEIIFSPLQKLIFIIGGSIAFIIIRFRYLDDLQIGFKAQQLTTARLEKSLGFFTPGTFDEEKAPIYPEKWEKAGTEEGNGKFFKTTYALLYVGFVFLLVAILLSS